MKNKKMLSILISLFVLISMISPMLAEATDLIEKSGSLTIHKLYFVGEMGETMPATGGEEAYPEGTMPLQGAEFTIWKVADDADINTQAMPVHGPAGVITTGENGQALFSNLPYGRYYVVETGIPKGVTQKASPFLVDIPTTGTNGETLLDHVHVYPKNVLSLGAAIVSKYGDRDGTIGLEGAQFTLYKQIGNMPDPTADLVINSGIETGSDGKTPVQENLEIGKYYFIETMAPTSTNPVYLIDTTPLAFEITATDNAYNNGVLDPLYIIQNEFINYPIPEVPIKTVDKPSADIGELITWTITAKLPLNVTSYDKYIIKDTIDSRLDYISGSVKLYLNNSILVPVGNYTLTESGGNLEVSFTKVPDNQLENLINGMTLKVTYETKINSTASPGVTIPNEAEIVYNNRSGGNGTITVVPAEVVTGGQKWMKVKQTENGTGLDGAEFIVYKKVDGITSYLKQDAGTLAVTWVADIAQASKFISANGGLFEVKGLAYSSTTTKYFLKETKAPAGYGKLQSDIPFTVGDSSYNIALPVINKAKPTPGMPQTGGTGTMLFSAIGLAFIALAAKVYKKEEKHTY